MKNYYALFATLFLFTAFACDTDNKEEDNLPMKVAKAYGYDKFDDAKTISYTWNVQANPERVVTRDWKWHVQDRSVYYADADTSYTYNLDSPKDELPKADGGFINDKYWLMFPYQLAWDTGYTYEVEEDVAAPISGEKTTKLIILYNAEDGYTPGDAYDLYLDDNHKIKEWVFRRGNGADGRPITWESEKDFNGLTFATEHKNAEGVRFIWFTDIEVEK